MIVRRRRFERSAAAATAVLLQALVYLALSPRHFSLHRVASAPTLMAMILTVARPKHEAPPPRHVSGRRTAKPAQAHPMERPITPLEPQKHAPPSAIDWQAAIQGEVGKELSRADARPKVRFGFPQMPAQTNPPPEFEWDEAQTHRIERLAHGIFDLNDHCFIRIWPPIPWCDFSPSNGDLFKHMHDPKPPPGPKSLP